MAGFEVVVRPVVLPNIRPTPARSLPPVDDPDSGFCVIKGNGGKHVSVSTSYSFSTSRSRSVETERRVDKARVYQKEDDGTVNKDNFVDIKVANRIKSRGGKLPVSGPWTGPDLVQGELVSGQKVHGDLIETSYYRPIAPEDNIEILERDLIEKGPSGVEPGGGEGGNGGGDG
jgi:hypothetical protein